MKAIIWIYVFFSFSAYGQKTEYSNEWGAPIGSAEQKGNKTEYYNQWGSPVGTAVTNGNKAEYSNQWGAPIGSSTGQNSATPAFFNRDDQNSSQPSVTTSLPENSSSYGSSNWRSQFNAMTLASIDAGKKTAIFSDSGELNGFIKKTGNTIEFYKPDGFLMSKETGNKTLQFQSGKYAGFTLDKRNVLEFYDVAGRIEAKQYADKIEIYDGKGKLLGTKDWPPKKQKMPHAVQ